MNHKAGIGSKRGSVLIVAVWMLGLLFLLTISLSRRANQQLLFVKYSMQKMQARYLAWAGFEYAVEKIREDSLDDKEKLFDNSYACGVKLGQAQASEDVFKSVSLGLGSFQIASEKFDGKKSQTVFGLSDEDGKLNLNALNLGNYEIFKELLMQVGVSQKQAIQIAADMLDWRDEDDSFALGEKSGQEGPFMFAKQAIVAKNRPFDNRHELMFINSMTEEIYQKIKDLVTVFPRRAERLQINFSTAPREVLLSLAHYFSGSLTGTSLSDADSLVAKILVLRSGPDKIEATADDMAIDEKNLSLTTPEENIFRAMGTIRTNTSRFLTLRSVGIDASGQRKSYINAVVDRESLSVVSWKAD